MAPASKWFFRSLLVLSSSVCLFTLLLLISYPFQLLADASETSARMQLLDWVAAGGMLSMLGGALSLVVAVVQKCPRRTFAPVWMIIGSGFFALLVAIVLGTD